MYLALQGACNDESQKWFWKKKKNIGYFSLSENVKVLQAELTF